jgi:hypothetical protein
MPVIWSLSCMEFMVLLAIDDVTEKFPRFSIIFEQPVKDRRAIVVRLLKDIYSTISFTYQSESSRDQTLIIWNFEQLGWKGITY